MESALGMGVPLVGEVTQESFREVRLAFLQFSRRNHPDKVGASAHETCAEVFGDWDTWKKAAENALGL